ncbi:MAG: class I SAM-dependent methyltransferase [Terriglobales bacterium]
MDSDPKTKSATFANCYEDSARAEAYATLEFRNTYHLAYRDIPAILREHVHGHKSFDFGCGTGRSTRFLRQLGFEVTGVDISEDMIRKARELDLSGDYHLIPSDDGRVANVPRGNLSTFSIGAYDLVLAAFTFDNIAGRDKKVRILRDLRRLLNPEGKLVLIVSRPEIYTHEWASFSTKDFPENRSAKPGDKVRIIVTDHADSRPVQDILWSDESYRGLFKESQLALLQKYEPLARADEPYRWISETEIAPWAVYVLGSASVAGHFSNVR